MNMSFIMRGILAAMLDSFLSADDGGVLDTQPDAKRVTGFPLSMKSLII
jgi:hypothetical protein